MSTAFANEQPLCFGPFELDRQSRELRAGGSRVMLQAQPFEVLSLLLERRGGVVNRDELRERLWPNGTFVDFEHSLNAAIRRLRIALADDVAGPRFIETVVGRGYRFVAPVTEPAAPAPKPSSELRGRIAVLPFDTLANDPAAEHFSNGLTEETIARLADACHGRIAVIARHSSMAFKDAACGVREIAAALRAEYIIEGSVRRNRTRLRITARLVETPGETQMWGASYERRLTDSLAVHVDVAVRIATAVASETLSRL